MTKRLLLALLFALGLALGTRATTYYIDVAGNGGNDANNGLSPAAPWLTPNHSVNCGDVIQAAASSSYSNANFRTTKWGTVTCAGNPNVAWLKCITFDACKGSGTDGFWIDKSYWGVQGFEVTESGPNSCFLVSNEGAGLVHHVIFANNIANGCFNTGFGASGAAGNTFDYIIYVGNIAYRTATSTTVCGQAFSWYNPVKYDSAPGTHFYAAGNFAWDNVNNPACNGGSPTDGDGIELDVWDGTGGSGIAYNQQAVVENNIFVHNGGFGIISLRATQATVYIRQNTLYGNMRDQHLGNCGEYVDSSPDSITGTIHVQNNIAATNAATCHSGSATYWAYGVGNSQSTLHFDSGVAYSAAGNNCGPAYGPAFAGCPGGLTTGTNPAFVNSALPGAPSCGSASSVPDCMSTMIANFTPTAGGMSAYGYQVPGPPRVDTLFPAWLCNVNLPTGLVTMGCATPGGNGIGVGPMPF